MLLIECEIPLLKLVIEILPNTTSVEERLLYLEQLDEHHRDAAMANKAHKKCIKARYNQNVRPRNFLEGDLVLVYVQDKDISGGRKICVHVARSLHCQTCFG